MRWYELVAVVVIGASIAANAKVMLDRTAPPEQRPTAAAQAGHDRSDQVAAPPVTVAGVAEQRPEWARELADKLTALASRLDQPTPTTTERTVRHSTRTTQPTRPASTPAPSTAVSPPHLIDSRVEERADPPADAVAPTTVPPTTVTPTTVPPTTVPPTTVVTAPVPADSGA